MQDTPFPSRWKFAFLFAAALGFGALALAVQHGDASGFDAAVRGAIHGWSTPWLTALFRLLTQLGGGVVLWPLGVVVAVWLVRAGRRREAVRFAIAVVAANLVDEAIKWGFHRVRPQPWFGVATPASYSFPSGHAFLSCVFYLLLAAAVARGAKSRWRKRAVCLAALALTLGIGLSRLYLGVHYPTDVLAGYLAAGAWLAGVSLVESERVK